MHKLQYPNICIIEWNAIHLKPGNKLTLHDDMHFYLRMKASGKSKKKLYRVKDETAKGFTQLF